MCLNTDFLPFFQNQTETQVEVSAERKKKQNPWHWDTDEYDKVEVIGIQ